MYWHIDTDVVSLIVIAALYVYYRTQPAQEENGLRDRRFLRCLIAGIFITVVDIAASAVMEARVPRVLYHILMTLYFASIELVIVEWFLYVLTILFPEKSRGGKAIAGVVTGVYALYAAFVLLNLWTGAIYRLGPDNVYERGPLFFLMLALYSAYTVALFLLILIRWRKIEQGYPGGVLLATPVIIAVGIAAQLLVPGLLLIMPAYMICLVFAFLFLQNKRLADSRKQMADLSRVAETDLLTGLYNRAGMEAMVQKTARELFGAGVVVLLVDIDDLKRINDTLGHAGGDEAIRAVGRQLRKHFRASDTVVRYGGDEFLAFLTGFFTEEQMRPSVEGLVEKLGALTVGEGAESTRISCSVGAAYGIVGRDGFEALCKRADAALYYVKRKGKNACAFYRPEMETEQLWRGRCAGNTDLHE